MNKKQIKDKIAEVEDEIGTLIILTYSQYSAYKDLPDGVAEDVQRLTKEKHDLQEQLANHDKA